MVDVASSYTARLHPAFTEAEVSLGAWQTEVIDLELREPMVLSFGTVTHRPSAWLHLDCLTNGQHAQGYGEGATLQQPIFTDDHGDNIAANVDSLVRSLQDPGRQTVSNLLAAIQEIPLEGGRFPTARLTVEVAIMDAVCKALGMSVGQVIGLSPETQEVPYGKSIGGHTKEALVYQAEKALASDAQKIKLKISPQLFTEVVDAIKHLRRNSDPEIMVDANGGFDPNSAPDIEMLRQLDGLGLLMIEEPVSRVGRTTGLPAVEKFREKLSQLVTPICLDDCLRTAEDCQDVITSGLADIINIKPARIGSFISCLDLVHFARQEGVDVMVGGMLEGTPGRCMTTILGAYCLGQGCEIPGDLSLAQERLRTDLVTEDRQLQLSPNGMIVVPTGLGWGF